MGIRDTQYRLCPFCKDKLSATAKKCLNCGKFVDGRSEEDEGGGAWNPALVAGIIAGLAAVGAAAWFLLRK